MNWVLYLWTARRPISCRRAWTRTDRDSGCADADWTVRLTEYPSGSTLKYGVYLEGWVSSSFHLAKLICVVQYFREKWQDTNKLICATCDNRNFCFWNCIAFYNHLNLCLWQAWPDCTLKYTKWIYWIIILSLQCHGLQIETHLLPQSLTREVSTQNPVE